MRVFQTRDGGSIPPTRTKNNMVPAPVAQRIRAMGFYPTGRGFESLPGYQNNNLSLSGVFILYFAILEHLTKNVGVKIAGGNLQDNLLLKTCFQRRNCGPADGRSNPSLGTKIKLLFIRYISYVL